MIPRRLAVCAIRYVGSVAGNGVLVLVDEIADVSAGDSRATAIDVESRNIIAAQPLALRCPDNRFPLVKIYTKTGDAGENWAVRRCRVPKDDPRVQAYGEWTELNAWIGFAVAIHLPHLRVERPRSDSARPVHDRRGAGDAERRKAAHRARPRHRRRAGKSVIDSYDPKLQPLKNFILPGGSPKAAALHVARTVCRRAERAVVALARKQQINPLIRALPEPACPIALRAGARREHADGHGDVAW